MNARDMIALMEYMKAFKGKDEAPKKPKSMFKEYMKLQQDMEEFEKWKKEKKPKDDKPKSWWDNLSVVQRAFYLTMFGPLLGMLWMLAIVKFAVMIGQSVGLR